MKHTNDNKCDVVLTFITSIIIITVKIGIDKSPREVACTFFLFFAEYAAYYHYSN